MTEPDNLWIGIGYVQHTDGDLTAEFFVDARRYPTDGAARAVIGDAGAQLRRRRMAGQFEYVDVRADEPPPDLPSWDEYRGQVLGGLEGDSE